jgi:hypothetical protein
MSKREKIIIGLTVLAILYGAYVFLFPSVKKATGQASQKSTAELNSFATKVMKDINLNKTSKINADILAKAATNWPRNPFISSPSPLTAELKVKAKKPEIKAVLKADLSYTGYMVIGTRQLAIINGVEYEIGDELDEKGYILTAISPTKATVRAIKSNQMFSLTLEEKLTAI